MGTVTRWAERAIGDVMDHFDSLRVPVRKNDYPVRAGAEDRLADDHVEWNLMEFLVLRAGLHCQTRSSRN